MRNVIQPRALTRPVNTSLWSRLVRTFITEQGVPAARVAALRGDYPIVRRFDPPITVPLRQHVTTHERLFR